MALEKFTEDQINKIVELLLDKIQSQAISCKNSLKREFDDLNKYNLYNTKLNQIYDKGFKNQLENSINCTDNKQLKQDLAKVLFEENHKQKLTYNIYPHYKKNILYNKINTILNKYNIKICFWTSIIETNKNDNLIKIVYHAKENIYYNIECYLSQIICQIYSISEYAEFNYNKKILYNENLKQGIYNHIKQQNNYYDDGSFGNYFIDYYSSTQITIDYHIFNGNETINYDNDVRDIFINYYFNSHVSKHKHDDILNILICKNLLYQLLFNQNILLNYQLTNKEIKILDRDLYNFIVEYKICCFKKIFILCKCIDINQRICYKKNYNIEETAINHSQKFNYDDAKITINNYQEFDFYKNKILTLISNLCNKINCEYHFGHIDLINNKKDAEKKLNEFEKSYENANEFEKNYTTEMQELYQNYVNKSKMLQKLNKIKSKQAKKYYTTIIGGVCLDIIMVCLCYLICKKFYNNYKNK